MRRIVAILLLSACPTGYTPLDDDTTASFTGDDDGTDDDSTDDDDTADDDASGDDDGTPEASWPADEAAFGLQPGNEWEFLETITADAGEFEDDVLITVAGAFSGPSIGPEWDSTVVAYEFVVDRALGADQRHWYGVDGSGRMFWMATETDNGLETISYPGDGGVVLTDEADPEDLLEESFDAVFCLTDIEGNDFSTTVGNIVEYTPPDAGLIEVLELSVYSNTQFRGTLLWEPGFGLRGLDVELGGGTITWAER